MAKKVKVEVDIDNKDLDQTGEKFTKLQLQIRAVNIELQKAAEAGDTVKFNKLRKELDDLEDSLEKVQFQSKQFDDQLSAMPGPAGKAGQAIKSVDSAFKMLIANPIIAIIAGIAAALMAMYKALQSTSEGQATLNKLSSAFDKILAPILALIEKVAIPVFSKFADIVSLAARGISWAAEKLGVSGAKVKEVYGNINEVQKKANEDEKKKLEEAQAERDKKHRERIEKEKQHAQELLKQKLEELKLLSGYEKEAMLSQLSEREKAIYQINEEYSEQEYLAVKHGGNLADIQKAHRKAIEKINADFDKKEKEERDNKNKKREDSVKEYLTKEYAYIDKMNDLYIATIKDQTERELAARQERYEREKRDLEKQLDEQIKLGKANEEIKSTALKNLRIAYLNDVENIEKNAALKVIDDKLRILELEGNTLAQGTRAQFLNRLEVLKTLEQKEILQAEGKEAEITKIQAKYTEKRKQLKKEEMLATAMAASATLDALASLGNALASSLDEEAKTSKKAFEQRKKLQIATAVMSAASGVIQILAQPSTLPSPADWIVKGINAAALAVSTAVNISKIKKTQFESPEAASSGGGASAPSISNIGQAMLPAPVIGSSMANPSAQLAQIASNTSQQNQVPIKAYVVSSEIKTMNQLERRIISAARL